MKKNISLLLCLSFFLSVMNGQIPFLQDHINKWTNGLKYTEDVMNALPDSLWNFKPVKEEMSFREQVLHITQNMYWLSSTYLKGESLDLKIKDEGQSIMQIKSQYLEIGNVFQFENLFPFLLLPYLHLPLLFHKSWRSHS